MTMSSAEKPGLLRRISGTFLAGLLAALPLALTLAVIIWLVEYIHRFMGPSSALGRMLRSIGLKFAASEAIAYLIGVVITLVSIYLLGLLVEAGMKNRWHALVDSVMHRVPLVRSVYNTLKKLMDMFDLKDQAEMKAMSAVMCHFGGRGGTAVLALMPSPERIQLHGRDYHGVLIPTAPVPFGGAILYVPAEWVEPLDVAFDELLNVYMSMGATSAEYLRPAAQGKGEAKQSTHPES
jgi:uncharacterized membrane protein